MPFHRQAGAAIAPALEASGGAIVNILTVIALACASWARLLQPSMLNHCRVPLLSVAEQSPTSVVAAGALPHMGQMLRADAS